jgi:hypothetical protein
LTALLEKLGFHPVKANGDDLWYLSPLRQEKTASFHVNAKKNVWYDFGSGKSGTIIDFVCEYLQSCGEDHTVIDALRFLDNMTVTVQKLNSSARESFTEATSHLSIKEIFPLQNSNLFHYLEQRGIPKALAKKYLKEVHLRNEKTGKYFYALGFRNEEKAYELRNAILKSCIGRKTITFIRGSRPMTKDIHVFEGIFDFLSALIIYKTEKMYGDCIILNSVSCLRHAFAYISNYHYEKMYSWMDNDPAGKNATLTLENFAKQQDILKHKPMNKIYAPYKDVNEWHIQNRGPKKN